MHEFAVTAIGADRPGIVAAVATTLRDLGGNVEDSAMTILGGHFAIVLLVAVDTDADTLRTSLRTAGADLGLTVNVSEVGDGRRSAAATHVLSVYGSDRPGLLAGVTSALASLDVNVTDLETRVLSPGDDPVYAMAVELGLPDTLTQDELAVHLTTVCAGLGVDHTLRALDAETY